MVELKRILQLNATSCLIFGGVFVVIPEATVNFLSQTRPVPELLMQGLGIVLILNGLHLILVSLFDKVSKFWLYYFSAGDFAWVLMTFALISARYGITSLKGITTATAVAICVGAFGYLQMRHIK
jgi:hypothetical protein